ncbi:MAG: trypsin-like peptidase domain-containing protein [Methylophilaceae bacterium]|nr:trypsin-like peptidase domain-containing protein [Methylophilaceae bacterium]MDG1445565.1 trypsin-like peptidase domain-containing protein [Methylophilaceae bacterium]MDG1820883.1 trypsin-like peptidase domain-containing protein [Methylophilaceae bacterium]
MRKIWLIFAQTVTICLGVLFVLQTFKPNLLGLSQKSITIKQATKQPSTRALDSYNQAAKKAMPAVVNIFTTSKNINPHREFMDDQLFKHFFGDQEEEPNDNSLGSGVIVSENGLILTNNHVIETADAIEVALADGRKLSASIVGADPESDLALLQVEAKDLPSITFASNDQLAVGDVVLAIGNPFGVGQTITQGIVSALGRNHLGINTYENFIQTDASINPGNSGGALIDTSGNLVGINSAIYSRNGGSMGIGFAIPISIAKQVIEQIAKEGSVTRGWVGVEAQNMTTELAESFGLKTASGALIAGILAESPADKAGLKAGDILIAINDRPVINSATMLNLIAALEPNKRATLSIVRAQKKLDIKILIGKRPSLND